MRDLEIRQATSVGYHVIYRGSRGRVLRYYVRTYGGMSLECMDMNTKRSEPAKLVSPSKRPKGLDEEVREFVREVLRELALGMTEQST